MSQFPPSNPPPPPFPPSNTPPGPPPLPTGFAAAAVPPDLIPPITPRPLYLGMAPHRGGLILGLGIASLGVWALSLLGIAVVPCCGASWLISVGLAIFAWVMANTDLRAMDLGKMDPNGRGNTQAGKICAIISVVVHTIGLIVILLLILLVGAFGVFAAASHGH